MVIYHLQVYVVAQRMSEKSTIEQYAVALAQHFVRTYPLVRLVWLVNTYPHPCTSLLTAVVTMCVSVMSCRFQSPGFMLSRSPGRVSMLMAFHTTTVRHPGFALPRGCHPQAVTRVMQP